jgi:hypothetical protein
VTPDLRKGRIYIDRKKLEGTAGITDVKENVRNSFRTVMTHVEERDGKRQKKPE